MTNAKIFGDGYKRRYFDSCRDFEKTSVYILQVQAPKRGKIHIMQSDDYNHFRLELNLGGEVKTSCGYNGSDLPNDAQTLISKGRRPLRFVTCEECLEIFKASGESN